MATSISLQGIGQLQRIVSKLYVKKVELVPRFDVNVKQCLAMNSVLFDILQLIFIIIF